MRVKNVIRSIILICFLFVNVKVMASDTANNKKVLIAYFTWAENIKNNDPNGLDEGFKEHFQQMDGDNVDAVASASIIAPGNVGKMARWIQQEVGGDLFSIQVTEPYSSNYDECMDRASNEKSKKARPKLKNKVDNIDQYDVVFLGYPNWWYTCPMAIHTFIEENDLSNKTVILFCSHGTGGLAASVRDIRKALPKSTKLIDNVVGVYRPEIDKSEGKVKTWVKEVRKNF